MVIIIINRSRYIFKIQILSLDVTTVWRQQIFERNWNTLFNNGNCFKGDRRCFFL